MGENRDALNCYERATESDPICYLAWYRKGDILLELGRYDEALKVYDKLNEIDPQAEQTTWEPKGTALYCLKRYDEAIALFDKLIELNTRNAGAWSKKGDALRGRGDYDEAIDCYNKTIELDSQDSEALLRKGDCLKAIRRSKRQLSVTIGQLRSILDLSRLGTARQRHLVSLVIIPNPGPH